MFAGKPAWPDPHIYRCTIFPVIAGYCQANCSDNNYHEFSCLQPSKTTSLLLCLSLPIVSLLSSVLYLPYCLKTNAVCFGFVLLYRSSFSTNSCSSYIKVYTHTYIHTYTYICIYMYTHTLGMDIYIYKHSKDINCLNIINFHFLLFFSC